MAKMLFEDELRALPENIQEYVISNLDQSITEMADAKDDLTLRQSAARIKSLLDLARDLHASLVLETQDG